MFGTLLVFLSPSIRSKNAAKWLDAGKVSESLLSVQTQDVLIPDTARMIRCLTQSAAHIT